MRCSGRCTGHPQSRARGCDQKGTRRQPASHRQRPRACRADPFCRICQVQPAGAALADAARLGGCIGAATGALATPMGRYW